MKVSVTQSMIDMVRRLPRAAALFDRDMRYLECNDAWRRVHFLDDAQPRALRELMPDIDAHKESILAFKTIESTVTLTRKPDIKRRVHWTLTACREGDEAAAILVLADVVGDDVKLLDELEAREEMIRILFDKSPIGLNLCRMDGLWIESNQAFLDIIGYTADEADGGLTYWELTPREYDDDEVVQIDHLVATGKYGPYEKEFIRKDGHRIPVRLNGFTIERDGEQYIWSMIEDITKERSLEYQIEQERLKTIHASKLATLGEMAAGFAYEINNPMAIIDGYASTLHTIFQTDDEELAKEAVFEIRDAVKRIAHIVRGLRKFAREDASGYIDLVPLSSVVDDAVRLCGARMKHHGIDLKVDVANDIVQCPPIEITQVMINLLNNAFDELSGREDRWVRVKGDVIDDNVCISIEDSGVIPSIEIINRMFQPFFTTKKVGDGTGLGLSISRGIVDRMGGKLYFDPVTDHPRFVIRFPVPVVR